jgi:mono/diheme cytochrome c family protein
MRFVSLFIAVLILSSTVHAQGENARINHQQKETGKTPEPGDNLKNPFTDKNNSAVNGKEIFIQNCASCHGTKGLGNGPAGASVTPKPDNLTSDEIHKQSDGALFLGISNGAHGVMIPWKFVLSEDQRWHLVDYIRELRDKSK